MTKEEIINALQDDKMMPFIQPAQLAKIVDFVSENHKPSLPEGLDEAAEDIFHKKFPSYTNCHQLTKREMLELIKAGWMARNTLIEKKIQQEIESELKRLESPDYNGPEDEVEKEALIWCLGHTDSTELRDMVSAYKAGWVACGAQIPKLPDDVAEAAEEYYEKYKDSLNPSDFDDYGCPIISPYEIDNAFISGAEWMAKKMDDEAYEEVVQEVYQDEYGIHCCVSVGMDYNPGDIVLVNTRKK